MNPVKSLIDLSDRCCDCNAGPRKASTTTCKTSRVSSGPCIRMANISTLQSLRLLYHGDFAPEQFVEFDADFFGVGGLDDGGIGFVE